MPTKPTSTENNVVEIVKAKHKRPKRSEEYLPHYEPGDMSRMIQQALDISSFGEIDSNDPKAVHDRITQYFNYCIQHDMKPSAEGMAVALNTNRSTLWRWREGVESNKPEGVRNAIKKGYSLLNLLLAQTMADGKINPVAAIFLLKNNHEYADTSQVIITPGTPLNGIDSDTAKQNVMDALPEE